MPVAPPMPDTPEDTSARPNQVVHLAAERWVIGLCEPLIPTTAKLAAEQAMVDLFGGERPGWVLGFASVFLHGLVTSLPAEDPWRQVRYLVPGGPQRNPAGLTEGGWVGTRPFGDLTDVTDLTTADQLDDPEVDFVTAGSLFTVDGWFTPAAAALVGAAGDSWRATFWALCVQLDRRSPQAVFADVVRATSAALHRRRTYLSPDVELPVHLMVSLSFADRVAAALGDEGSLDLLVEKSRTARVFEEYEFMAERVPDGTYQKFKRLTEEMF